MSSSSSRHQRVADPARSVLMVIDLQQSYVGKLHEEQRVVEAARKLLASAEILKIPVILTEQYPERLGSTRSEITDALPPDALSFPKRSFSCLGAEGLETRLKALGRDQVIVAGIETHVCVAQTVHDLLAAGYSVQLARDAISARFPFEDELGFQKMVGSGAIPTSVEGLLFEWLQDSRAPEFKAIHKLVV